MMSEKSGPLESGSYESGYVLVNEHGEQIGPADTLRAIRERRDELNDVYDLHVVREDRTVVSDSADPDTLGVADLASVHEALTADHAILTGEADELDARRPHPQQYAFLYDVAESLRARGKRAREVREVEINPRGEADE